jgi:excisionase family DNA binding protein
MKLYTCSEAAAVLGVTDTRVRVLCRSGRLGRKHGRAWMITEQDLKRYQNAGPMKPGKKVTT